MSFDFNKKYENLQEFREFRNANDFIENMRSGNRDFFYTTSSAGAPNEPIYHVIATTEIKTCPTINRKYFSGYVTNVKTGNTYFRENLFLNDFSYGCKAIFTSLSKATAWRDLVTAIYNLDTKWQSHNDTCFY